MKWNLKNQWWKDVQKMNPYISINRKYKKPSKIKKYQNLLKILKKNKSHQCWDNKNYDILLYKSIKNNNSLK